MKVFFNTKLFPEKILKKIKYKDAILVKNKLSSKNINKYKNAKIIIINIYTKLTKEFLDKLPKLKLIITMSTGFDHIDLEECKKRKIIVTNVPNYSNESVAEHALALLFTISKKIHICNRELEKGKIKMPKLTGFELKNKTIGIIGTGSIGQHMAKISKGTGMKVIAYDIKQNKKTAKKIGFTYVTFENLIKTSDIITLHLPLNKHTKHLLNKEQFQKMKNTAVIINTARGEIINSQDLLDALNTEKIAFAGLDVFKDENFNNIKDSTTKKLIKHKNVVATPHAAFNTIEALDSLITITLENIESYLNNKPIKNKVI